MYFPLSGGELESFSTVLRTTLVESGPKGGLKPLNSTHPCRPSEESSVEPPEENSWAEEQGHHLSVPAGELKPDQ